MLVEAELKEVVYGPRGMLEGIKACLERQCLVSALSLIYSTIDALSALSRPIGQPDTDRNVFKKWVSDYMDLQGVRCSAADIYGARCGVLHTYKSESSLSREKNAARLVYMWRSGPKPDSRIAAGALVICVEDLFESLENGVTEFVKAADQKPDLRDKVESHIRELLCYKPYEVVEIDVAA